MNSTLLHCLFEFRLFVKAAMRITSDEVLSNPIVLSLGLVE